MGTGEAGIVLKEALETARILFYKVTKALDECLFTRQSTLG